MIDLIAFSPTDGWAIACDGEQWWRLAPTYEPAYRMPISELVAARMLMEQHMPMRTDTFEGMDALIAALKRERAALSSEQQQ